MVRIHSRNVFAGLLVVCLFASPLYAASGQSSASSHSFTDQPPAGLSPAEWHKIRQHIQQDLEPQSANAILPILPYPTKKLTAGDAANGDGYGISVATSGDTVVIGSYNATVSGNLQRGAAYIYSRNQGGASDNWGEVKKITAFDGAANDHFGISVAISGDIIVIGSWGADISGQSNQGAAYIFYRNESGADQWGLKKKIVAGDGGASDYFGTAVAIGGSTVLVGADGDVTSRGSAYIFYRNQGGSDFWGQKSKLTASDGAANNYFGGAVALAGDIAVVGAWGADVLGTPGQGSAFIFSRNYGGADSWGQVKKMSASDGAAYERFGYAVAINYQADTIVVGAYQAAVSGLSQRGAAYIFTRNQGGSPDNWGQHKKLIAADGAAFDFFGRSVAINGDIIMVGASGDDSSRGSVYLFLRNQDGADQWGLVLKYAPGDGAAGDNFGIAVALNDEADNFLIGAPGFNSWRGAAYLLSAHYQNWAQKQKKFASDGLQLDHFASPVAISGDILVVGARQAQIGSNIYQGAAYVFYRNWGGADNWGQVKKLVASDGWGGDFFGQSVAIHGDTIVVGAESARISGIVGQGAAYVFSRNQGGADMWGEVKKLVGSSGAVGDHFGCSVGIDQDTIAVGAIGKLTATGAVYVFYRNQGGMNNWGEGKMWYDSDPFEYDQFGWSLAIDGDLLVVGSPGKYDNDGRAYVFRRNQGGADVWGEVAVLGSPDLPSNGYFGSSVAIADDTIVVGRPFAIIDGKTSQGDAYIFSRNQGGADHWGQVKRLIASDGTEQDTFGNTVALSGDVVVVGAIGDVNFKGAAYFFSRNQGGINQWGELKKLTPRDGNNFDSFGVSVAIFGQFSAIGASGVDSNKGAVYIYQEVMTLVFLPLLTRVP